MADGQPQPQQPRPRMAPYRETFWVMAMSLLTPIGLALIILISFKTLTVKGALLAGDVASAHAPIELQCESCHSNWEGPTDAKCQACHQPQLVKDHAPGWTLPADHLVAKDTDCKHCHIDHHGRMADLKAQASTDCILCHGFKSTGEATNGHPEVRMVAEKLSDQLLQSGIRQFKHSDHVGMSLDRSNPNSAKLDCKSCHQFKSGDRVLLSTDVKFDKDCKTCHSDQLTWTPDRHTPAVTVTHPNMPNLADMPGFTRHDQFVNWASKDRCGQCHYLIEKRDTSNPALTVGMEVASTTLQSENTWLKLQHWGYSEFSHAKHLDPNLSGASHALHCADCHSTNDEYLTFDTPSFDKQCIQCHATQTAIHRGPTLKHPALPVYADPKGDDDARNQLTEQMEWTGHDPNNGSIVSAANTGARQCALCHQVDEQAGLTDKMKSLKMMTELELGARYAGLDPLLAQATDSPSPTDSASASPGAAASPTAAASPAADTASPAASASPQATSPAPSASAVAASPSASPSSAPTLDATPSAPPAVPEDTTNDIGPFYKLHDIAKVQGPVSLAANFVHRPHLTIKNITCEDCHKLNVSKGTSTGPGFFDMQLLPPIATCAKCHNSKTDGVTNRCGSCHDFHDKTKRTPSVPVLAPQTRRPDGPGDASLFNRLANLWKGGVAVR